MKKNVYSLVLMDEVVQAIDHMAYQLGTSRSNLINQILAERVALRTPEMQMRHVFENMEILLQPYHHFQVQQQAAESMMSIKSILRYKYNPTIRYAIALERNPYEKLGEIRVISRSQSEVLKYCLNEFFDLWTECEQKNALNGWTLDQTGRYTRVLKGIEEASVEGDNLAMFLVNYVRLVDEGMKMYFQHHKSHEDRVLLKQHFTQIIKKENIKL